MISKMSNSTNKEVINVILNAYKVLANKTMSETDIGKISKITEKELDRIMFWGSYQNVAETC